MPVGPTAHSRRPTTFEQQRQHGERRFGARALLAFERGQRQQIVDEALHAVRLLRHQLQVARALARLELHVLQRLEKSGDDRQRRLELVRDVGDEIAAHARDGFDLRDVAADQQALLDAERHDLNRQRRSRLALRIDHQRVGEVRRLEVAGRPPAGARSSSSGRPASLARSMPRCACARALAHWMRFAASRITMPSGSASTALLKPLDRRREVALARGARARAPVERGERERPCASASGTGSVERRVGPARQPMELPQMVRRRAPHEPDGKHRDDPMPHRTSAPTSAASDQDSER